MDYYPGIAEDDDFDDTTSCGSADISLQPGRSRTRHNIQSTRTIHGVRSDIMSENNDDDDSDGYVVDDLIENERYRRLGTRGNNNTKVNNNRMPPPPPRRLSSELSNTSSNNPGGVLGNIRGWFGGGGGGSSAVAEHPPNNNHQSHAPNFQSNINGRNTSFSDDDSSSSFDNDTSSDDDSQSSSQSSSCDNSDRNNHTADLTPQERARARALRYLSDSCVDAGRKAKTSSYVWGLERLDLKRRRDRYEKELEIVEAEMNKDRGLLIHNNNSSSSNESDAIWSMAEILVSEVPRQGNADAGGGGVEENYVNGREKRFMKYDDYSDDIWENKDAVNVYVSSLQSRLKDAQERTRSLEKRLAVLEQAGDDIISSLCEDLADVTGQSNKVEAKYVKKGKELQRKRRREELLYRKKITQAELRVQKLEEKLMIISGGHTNIDNQIICANGSDTTSNQDSRGFENDDEYDEVILEKKLSAIKARNGEDKNQHMIEVESIRRQCEQLKLRLSVTRLVMEGEDNLRDYIRLLEGQQRKCARNNDYIDQDDFSDRDGNSIISIPPLHITRARAMLLKIGHLECIYEQRLSVSKAFTDATINALDQELIERESASQKMEVRCLNELLLIDLEIKDIIQVGKDKLDMLDAEAQELDDAISAYVAQIEIANIGDMFGVTNYCNQAVEHGKTIPVAIDGDDVSSSGSIPKEEEDAAREFDGKEQINDSPETALPVSELQIKRISKSDEDGDESKMDNDNINEISMPLDACINFCDDMENIVNDSVKETSEDVELDEINEDMSQSSQMAKCDTLDVVETKILISEDSVDELYSLSQGKSREAVRLDVAINQNVTESECSNNRDENVDDHNVESCDDQIVISNVIDSQKRIELQSLAHELNSTHAEYLSSYDASISSDRVKRLNRMNDLVVAIANLSGLKIESSDETAVVEERQLVSWSYKKPHRKSSEKDRKQKSKKRRHRNKDNDDDSRTKDELIRYLKAN